MVISKRVILLINAVGFKRECACRLMLHRGADSLSGT